MYKKTRHELINISSCVHFLYWSLEACPMSTRTFSPRMVLANPGRKDTPSLRTLHTNQKAGQQILFSKFITSCSLWQWSCRWPKSIMSKYIDIYPFFGFHGYFSLAGVSDAIKTAPDQRAWTSTFLGHPAQGAQHVVPWKVNLTPLPNASSFPLIGFAHIYNMVSIDGSTSMYRFSMALY